MAGIRNPSQPTPSALVTLRVESYSAANEPTELYFQQFALFLAGHQPGQLPTVPHIVPATSDFFQNGSSVQSAGSYLELQAYLPTSAVLSQGYSFLFAVPSALPLVSSQLAPSFQSCGCSLCVTFV